MLNSEYLWSVSRPRLVHIGVGSLLATGMLLGTACQRIGSDPSAGLSPTPTIATTTVSFTTPPAQLGVVMLADITTSTKTSYVSGAMTLVADQLQQWLQPGHGGAQFVLSLIDHDSYDTANERLAFQFDGLPPKPVRRTTVPRPAQPDYASCQANAFSRAQCEQHLTATYNTDLAKSTADEQAADMKYAETLDSYNKLVAQREGQVKSLTDRLRGLDLPIDDTGTDVSGALLRGAQALAAMHTPDKYLVIQSDLVPSGPQQPGSLDLTGVHVVVVYWDCHQDDACSQRQQAMEAEFKAAGAASVQWYDPAGSALITDLFTTGGQS